MVAEAKVYKPRTLTRKQWAAHKAWITKRAKYGKTGHKKAEAVHD